MVGLQIRLSGAFDDQLREQASLTLATVQTRNGTIQFDPAQSAAARRIGSFVRVIDRDGRVVADTSRTLGEIPLDQKDVTAALAGQTRFSSVRVSRQWIRIVSLPVAAPTATEGVLQVGLPRGEIDEVLHEVLVAILVAAPAAVVVSLAGGYFLARRALAPVAAISQLAGKIGGDDLHARLALELPDDELGQLAATFDGMLARIETAFERQRRFTGDAAHELRTPLALMRGRIDLARSRPRTIDEHLTTLDGLDRDLARLSGVVGALLSLARSDTGRLVVERDVLDLAATIRQVVDQYSDQAATAGVELRSDLHPAEVEADEDLVVQVLVNLMDNALAHTTFGGNVAIGCQANGSEVALWVADTGSGMDAEHLERVFDRFYRVDRGRGRGAGGVGLGLSICRAIADAHGGSILLTSALGEGTRVELTLPSRSRSIA